eukprot:4446093-Pyramimonas_sp.AAC.1
MSSVPTSYEFELKSRISAVRQAWYQMGGFWTLRGVPHRLRRCLLISKIYNVALSGVEAFLPSVQQVQRLQHVVAQYARKAMLGQAVDWTSGVHPKSLSSAAVLRWWRLVPLDLEIRIRRLRLWQSVSKVPGAHRQLLACLFGAFGSDHYH